MDRCYEKVMAFKKKFPGCLTFRLKKHCNVIDKHLNPGEELLYAFAGQLNDSPLKIFDTGVICVTSERLVVAQNYLWPGYKFISITPDLYNDLTIKSGIIWGTIGIDTIKESVYISNISKASMPEIETIVTTFMQEMKKSYPARED